MSKKVFKIEKVNGKSKKYLEFERKYKTLMKQEGLWNTFQYTMDEESKWKDYYSRILKTEKLIKKHSIGLNFGRAGFYIKNLDQGFALLFHLRFEDNILECFLIDEGEPIDYEESPYEKNSLGDAKYIVSMYKKYC